MIKKKVALKLNSFGLAEQIFFSQRLSLLLNSGISIVDSLKIMRNLDTSFARKKIYEILLQDVRRGLSLNRSIKNIELKLNPFLCILIKNGEESGRLAETLSQAYIYLEKSNDMKKKIISALIYPTFIVIATVGMTLFLILFIFPKIIPLLGSLNIQLPLITRIVQGFYYFMIGYGIWSGIFLIVAFFVMRFMVKKNIKLRRKIHQIIISIPFMNGYIKIYFMSTLCGIGEMLLNSGKGLPDIVSFWSESSRNMIYQETFTHLGDELKKGVSLTSLLDRHKHLFPVVLNTMVSIGERTGNLAHMMGHCSRIFEQDIDNFLKRFTSLIEPVLMVFMGLVVGSVALSIILPVYEITNHLSK